VIGELIVVGVVAGIVSGMLGVGGGVIMVPGLVLVVGLSQVAAEATSLAAIVPIALVGTWRQRRYGNVRLSDGLLLGALAASGAVGGVALANALPERALELGFAGLMLFAAAQLLRRAMSGAADDEDGAG
jgi:uncharacterized membrane protein YfcA